MTERELLDKICVLLGGRVAEEIAFGDVSTGAQDDLVKATDIARSMVRSYGMSQALGPLSFERGGRPLFLGTPEAPVRPDVSEEVLRQIDTEVRRIVETEHARAQRLLEERSAVLGEAARVLLERETLSGEELREIASRAGATARSSLRDPAPQEG
jgi:cell division protease FtsH